MCVCAHTVCQNRQFHHVGTSQFLGILALFSIHVCLTEMYVYFISQTRIHLSYWGTHKKWCMEIGFYIFYICSLKHTFDIRFFIMHLKNLRKPAEIRHFLTNQFITVNPYVTGSSPVARAKISADSCGFFNVFHTILFLTKSYERSQIYPQVR